ncbi:alpha/beta knot, partial [Saccharata proteae CBS 121410]
VGDDKLPMLDQMSEGRPHNGIVLEASPLPMFSANYLDVVSRGRPYFTVRGKDDQRFSYNSHGWRFPFILYLDGIKDSGNMGAIIRSAYYLGVDAIFTSSRATAPVDSVTIKASAGAAEVVPIGTVVKPQDFLAESRKHGWRVYAADAPEPPRENFNVTESHRRTSLDPENTSPLVQIRHLNDTRLLPLHSPVLFHPTMLMMGGEGDGLSIRLKRLADYLVGIRGVKGEAIAMDSLNVSVAAAMLSLEFLKKPSDKLKQRARQQFAEPRKPKRDDGFLF